MTELTRQPEYVLLETWAASAINPPPSPFTLRSLVRANRIAPTPHKIGKQWYTHPRSRVLVAAPVPPQLEQPRRKKRKVQKVETALYRHFAADGTLLYVGISLSVAARLSQHMHGSRWAAEIARVEVTQYPYRAAAVEAEQDAIRSERPKFNIAGREGASNE